MMTPPTLPEIELVDSRENSYFTVLAVISGLVWLVVAVTCFGIFYAVLIGFFLWLANGLLVARLRTEGVEVTPGQAPDLHEALVEVCGRLGLKEVPRLYVLQEGGVLNAFTTRHSSRAFIVIYSEMLQACGTNSPEVKFVLGHEIGHIRRNHILKSLFVLPGRILPLIGDAYSRACERTCDRHGFLAAGTGEGAARAMMMLAAGPSYGKSLSLEEFASQSQSDRGFFVSWHELTSAYPTLSQRVSSLLALQSGQNPAQAKRHPLAYLFALFTLSCPGGGLSSLLMTVFVLAMLFAIAIPNFAEARRSAQELQEEALMEQAERQKTEEVLTKGEMPAAFVGTWAGRNPTTGDEYLAWQTLRASDGSLTTHFTSSKGSEQSRWTKTGQWRVFENVYYEIVEGKIELEMTVKAVQEDKIELLGDTEDEESLMTETREKP